MTSASLIKAIKDTAFLEGDFTTRAGKKTDYYIDKYLFETQPNILNQLTDSIAELIKDLDYDLIAAPAFGAVPISAVLAKKTNDPFIIIKHQSNDKPLILGDYTTGQKVIIIEDILTSGKTSLETAQYLNSIGLEIVTVVSVVNREEGGVEALTKHGFNNVSLMTSGDLKRF